VTIRSTPAEAVCARRAEPWVLAATIVGSSMAFIDTTVVNVALPVLQSDLLASVAGVQWVVESYALLLAALLLVGGSLGDRHGRRRTFAAGIAVFALASAWCGLAPTIGHLIAARAVQGVGAAILIPTSLALIGVSFPPERRGRAIGTWSAFSAMTMALGPVLGGWLVQNVSWRAVFFINVPLAAAVMAILFLSVPESRKELGTAPMDWPGAILASLGLGGLTFSMIESSSYGLQHPAVVGGLGGGAMALAAFLAVEARSQTPMVALGLFRSRLFSGANLLTLFLYGALSGALFFLPFNLLQIQGYSATAAGASLLPFSLLLFLLSRWSGSLADRVGVRLPLVLGPSLAALGLALFALPGIGGSYWITFFPAVAVLGLGMAVTVAPLTTAVLGAVGEENTGVASAVNNAVSRVAGLLAIALLGVFMVATFNASLDRSLAAIQAPPDVVRELRADRTHLAAIELPEALDPLLAESIRGEIARSFVAGFRRVMLICAGLALAGAIVAWVMIRGVSVTSPKS
jgi:EmrB/QacA subfamily drug resistance transporter